MTSFKWSKLYKTILLFVMLCIIYADYSYAHVVKIGLNYPKTGVQSVLGLDQWRCANMILDQINDRGGILGKHVEVVFRDTKSNPDIAVKNVKDLIDNENVKMIFGGATSPVAIAVSKVCQEKRTLFMATITAVNEVTCEYANRYTFRVCYNDWMSAKALSVYLNKNFKNKKYFYVVVDYNWGWSAEASIRKFTNTEDRSIHKRVLTPIGADNSYYKKAISFAKLMEPDVLVLVLAGNGMSLGIKIATMLGMKKNCQIVVPILGLGQSEKVGPKIMQGVIGTSDWIWNVPYKYNYKHGKEFIEKFVAKYKRYPGWGAHTVYTNLMEYKSAVERAKTFESSKVIKALEGHKFAWLKDEQCWRDFDHQCVQSVYVLKGRPQIKVLQDKFKLNYFEVLEKFSGDKVTLSYDEWKQARELANLPIYLEKLPDE